VPISGDLVARINGVAARYQATPFMVLLAAFKVLLYRYSGQPNILVGVPVAGRTRVETEGLIGFFVNTLVLRDNLSGNPQFAEVLTHVRETTLGAFANADVPFETIVEALQPERNLSYNPIFQVMFAAIKSAVRSHQFGGLTAFPYVVSTSSSIFDLSMTLIEGVDGESWAQIEYNTKLFQYGRIRQMLGDYISILGAVTSNPEIRIFDLRGLSVPRVDDLPESSTAPNPDAKAIQGATLPDSVAKAQPAPQWAAAEQKMLVEVWKRVLGLPSIGIHDNFFDLGGHSLMAARLILQIRSLTGREIPVSAIFRAPTIESFARLLQQDSISKTDPVVMPLHQGSGIIPFFTVAAPGVDTTGFALLARQMGEAQSTYKLQPAGPVVWSRPFSKEELLVLKPLCLITAKPAMFVGNVAETGFENNPYLDKLRAFAEGQKAPVVAICAKTEAELSEMPDDDKLMFLQEMGQTEPGLNRLIRAAFKLLGLQTYFTAGVKEVRAWTIHVGDTAPQAAGVIHTDFERGFIRAQTIAFDDFIAFKGEQGAKDAGKMRAEGKEYVVKDGDVLNFLFNV